MSRACHAAGLRNACLACLHFAGTCIVQAKALADARALPSHLACQLACKAAAGAPAASCVCTCASCCPSELALNGYSVPSRNSTVAAGTVRGEEVPCRQMPKDYETGRQQCAAQCTSSCHHSAPRVPHAGRTAVSCSAAVAARILRGRQFEPSEISRTGRESRSSWTASNHTWR